MAATATPAAALSQGSKNGFFIVITHPRIVSDAAPSVNEELRERLRLLIAVLEQVKLPTPETLRKGR